MHCVGAVITQYGVARVIRLLIRENFGQSEVACCHGMPLKYEIRVN